jgi:hypothetical protein
LAPTAIVPIVAIRSWPVKYQTGFMPCRIANASPAQSSSGCLWNTGTSKRATTAATVTMQASISWATNTPVISSASCAARSRALATARVPEKLNPYSTVTMPYIANAWAIANTPQFAGPSVLARYGRTISGSS